MNNTVGIIDSDYFYSDNEGHIFVKLTNDSNEGKTVSVEQGTGMVQGIFMQYGVTIDDDVTEVRNGGFGSTTKTKQSTIKTIGEVENSDRFLLCESDEFPHCFVM